MPWLGKVLLLKGQAYLAVVKSFEPSAATCECEVLLSLQSSPRTSHVYGTHDTAFYLKLPNLHMSLQGKPTPSRDPMRREATPLQQLNKHVLGIGLHTLGIHQKSSLFNVTGMSLEEGAHLLYTGYPDGLENAKDIESSEYGHASRSFARNRFTEIFIVAQSLLCVALSVLLLQSWYGIDQPTTLDPTLALYSPVNHLVEYETVRFNRSRGADKTPFQGWPTDEIDAVWEAAYAPGILSSIDERAAGQLLDQTSRVPVEGREREFMMTLDVFHQMHCLDVVRQALYRDRYDKHFYFLNGTLDHCKWVHVDHCIDQVRQALMCSADVSVVHYSWSDVVEGTRPRVDNLHTCRNYDKLLDWATERALGTHEWHPSRKVVEEHGGFRIEKGRNQALNGGGECNAV